MTSQAAKNVIDNVGYESFCDFEEIRVVFFLASSILAAEPAAASFPAGFLNPARHNLLV